MSQTLQAKHQNRLFFDLHDTTHLEALIQSASKVICPVWPLDSAVACNPLVHLEDRPFWEAIKHFQKSFYQPFDERIDHINKLMIKWLEPFLDETTSFIEMPSKYLGFWNSFKDLARFDKTIISSPTALSKLLSLPEDPLKAIAHLCENLHLDSKDLASIFETQFSSLSGFSGYVRWYSQWKEEKERSLNINLSHLLATRLALIWLLYENSDYPLKTLQSDKRQTYEEIKAHIRSQEEHFIDSLTSKLVPFVAKPSHKKKHAAQFIFCIDARSEPLRRSLESEGPYSTYGFAGFFGLSLEICPKDEPSFSSCPVLLKSTSHISVETKNKARGYSLKKQMQAIYKSLKSRFGTAFTLVETVGFFSGLYLSFKTFFPKKTSELETLLQKPSAPHLHLEALTVSQKLIFAKTALTMLDLTHQIADLVVICGHGSQSLNNPFASSLDCGACGGHPGDVNARVLAMILNDPSIRAHLKEEGLPIPPTTLFLGAFHNTVTDEIRLFEEDLQTAIDLTKIKQDLKAVRCKTQILKNSQQLTSELSAAYDWSNTRPEWGLAGNAAFIIAPREVTADINLKGRSFLHSYDYKKDSDFKFLETILTAPVIVAEWINMQYFFSCLDPIAFGSLSKITHNITGKFGVMRGNSSDLMHGLPLESVFVTHENSYHQLIRLHVIVYAPFEEVIKIVDKYTTLTNLVYNEWIKLIIIDPRNARKYTLSEKNTWHHESF